MARAPPAAASGPPLHNDGATPADMDPKRQAWASIQSWYTHSMAHIERRVTVGERGRVVLPSAVRRELDLKPGTHMLLSTEQDGSLRLRPYRAVAEQSRGLLRDLPGGPMVDGLLAERRAEAAREGAE
jgi:AbrB family transcriptional regulator, stage V sporulation protein T